MYLKDNSYIIELFGMGGKLNTICGDVSIIKGLSYKLPSSTS